MSADNPAIQRSPAINSEQWLLRSTARVDWHVRWRPTRTATIGMRSLPVGAYKVTAEIFGFKSFILNGIDLAVAQEVALNLTLEVGTTAEQVTVTGEAPLVELRYSESV